MTQCIRWFVALAALASCACGDGAVPGEPSASATLVPVPAGEPPADVVRALLFEQYDEINKAGGLPVTMTATGQSLVIKPTLYEARVEQCRPVPQAKPGDFECSLIILLSLQPGDGKPSEQGERLFITWDAARGRWAREGTVGRAR
jgi:hypothetical protein